MAYQTRGRDPLLDSNMAEAIEKRGKELIGIALIIVGLMAAAMIFSYTPDDPNWMVSTDAQAQNWLGRSGASIAAPLFMIVGLGAWAIAAVLLAWGARFAMHFGQERAVGRLIFAPIAVALVSIYGATLEPGQVWLQMHSFGLGGLFGDTVMGAILTALPLGSSFAIKLMSLILGVGILALGAFVLGFTKPELMRTGRFLLIGLIMLYAGLMTLLGKGANSAVLAARDLQERNADRKERHRVEADEAAAYQAAVAAVPSASAYADPYSAQTPEPMYHEPAAYPEPVVKTGLLARMPSLIKRAEPVVQEMPESELIETFNYDNYVDAPDDDLH